MRTIWKYELYIEPVVTVAMPKGAKILPHVDIVSQEVNHFVIWAEVDDQQPMEDRILNVFGTGHEIPAHKQLDHIGTFRLRFLYWHVFERNHRRERMLAENLEALKAEVDKWSKTRSQR